MNLKATIIPGPKTAFAELSRSAAGKLFKKQILKFGEFAHPNLPGEKLTVDKEVGESLVRNFANGVCDIVQIPVVDGANRHTEDPLRNIGEVVDLTVEDDGIYAVMDIRKPEYEKELGKTLIGVSAMMHMDYTDTRNGDRVGPTLLHCAVTNRPYITNLKDYEEIVAASADSFGDEAPLVLTESEEEKPDMFTKEQLLQMLKDDHGVDVEGLQAELAAKQEFESEEGDEDKSKEFLTALSNVLAQAGVIQASGDPAGEEDDTITVQDVAEAVIELSQEKISLSGKVERLEAEAKTAKEAAATKEVEDLIKAGRILPKSKDTMIDLAQNDRAKFDNLVPDSAIVSLSEDGVETHDEPLSEEFKKETARLVELAHEIQGRSK